MELIPQTYIPKLNQSGTVHSSWCLFSHITVLGLPYHFALPSNIASASRPLKNGGLDYTKAIPIIDESFIDMSRKAIVRQCDWPIIQSNRKRIKAGMLKYIEQYKRAKKNARNPVYKNLIRYSTLQYFEDELGLNS